MVYWNEISGFGEFKSYQINSNKIPLKSSATPGCRSSCGRGLFPFLGSEPISQYQNHLRRADCLSCLQQCGKDMASASESKKESIPLSESFVVLSARDISTFGYLSQYFNEVTHHNGPLLLVIQFPPVHSNILFRTFPPGFFSPLMTGSITSLHS